MGLQEKVTKKAFANLLCALTPVRALWKELASNPREFMEKRRQAKIKRKIAKFWEARNRAYAVHRQPERLSCRLCGYEDAAGKFEQLHSECLFGAGKLMRYKCLKCGVIFGDLKVLDMTPKQIGRAYEMLYRVYSEGDSSLAQIEAFYKLSPKKNGKYLNFGCGNSKFAIETLRRMRADGYEVYGYDPYAKIKDQELVGRGLCLNKRTFSKMEFDGILTHNVLEHLFDPIGVTKMLLSKLSPGGLLMHSTACFEYVYEFTGFHVFFFTGDSVKHLAERAGAEVQIIHKSEMEHMNAGAIFKKK